MHMASSSSIEGLDIDELYAFALDLSKRAGELLVSAAEKRRAAQSSSAGNNNNGSILVSTMKLNSVDLVTETDEQIEQFIKATIAAKYPTHSFLGEESYSKGATRDYLITPDAPPTWCIDPLDGTVNYIHLFPMVCISIALVYRSQPVIGVINAPFTNSLFSGAVSKGAWFNETQRLPFLSPPPPLPSNAPRGCIFSCEWGKDRRDVPEGNLYRKAESFLNMAAEVGGRGGKGGMVHGVRSLGSAALDLAYTATGAFDIWWEGGCWEWDVAAGICILREAGGLVTNGIPPPEEGDEIPEVRLGGRRYLGIRAAGDTPEEKGIEAQKRVVHEVWKRVVPLDYSRPGC